MKSRLMIVACVAVLAAFSWVRAEDKPAAEQADKKPAPRLVAPFSKLTSLTDEQKTKLKEIRAKMVEDLRAIQEKAKTDMMAVLTDEQKEEVKKLMEAAPAAKKSDAADAPAAKP